MVKLESKTALIACALFCDWSLEQVDGDPRDFCLVSKRQGDKFIDYTSNLAPGDLAVFKMLLGAAKRKVPPADRLTAAEALMKVAGRLVDDHIRAHGG